MVGSSRKQDEQKESKKANEAKTTSGAKEVDILDIVYRVERG